MRRPVSGGTGSDPATQGAGRHGALSDQQQSATIAAQATTTTAQAAIPSARPAKSRSAGTGGAQLVRTVDAIRAVLQAARSAGATIGLVPTMGALHEGHLSLIRKAREQCDVVVVSVFVNPTQFNERADLDAYPRRTDSDRKLAAKAGADIVFAPAVQEIYPPGFDTAVAVGEITQALEGAVRGAGHFSGVATVVLKLLNLTNPDVAYFGQKDAQQVVVIRKLVRDLNVAVRIETCPTVRESDGLAMSSRNARLSSAERARAVALHRGLVAARERAATGMADTENLLDCARAAMAEFDVVPEYLELVDPETLASVTKLKQPGLLLVAARLGDTRLIDNTEITPTVPLRLAHATEREAALCSA